jgi:hypothetical protein
MTCSPTVIGVDFTSAPGPRKPLTAAHGLLHDDRLEITGVDAWAGFEPYERALAGETPTVIGVDHPFGLPRAAIRTLGWDRRWTGYVAQVARLGRAGFAGAARAYAAGQPPGRKHPRRATDVLARAASPLNVVRPPVGLMFAEGAPRLLAAGVDVVGCRRTAHPVTVVEVYPALVARRWLAPAPYKDGPAAVAAERRDRRRTLLAALTSPAARAYVGFDVAIARDVRAAATGDPAGDVIDAVACAVLAAWACRADAPARVPRAAADEGWILDPGLDGMIP